MTKFIALLALLLISGCADYRHLHNTDAIAIDARMPAEATEAIMAGVEAWGAATGGKVALRARIGAADGDALVTFGEMATLAGRTDITVHAAPVIVIDLTQPASNVQETLMHELGHAFGLEEHETGTLMQSGGWVGGSTVDARTLERWRALR